MAHIAGILGERGTVFAFGALPSQIEGLQQRMQTLEVNSILLLVVCSGIGAVLLLQKLENVPWIAA